MMELHAKTTLRLTWLAMLVVFLGTLEGMFSQILQGEDIVRERAIKFLSLKLKTLPEEVMTKEVEDYVFAETKKVNPPLCTTGPLMCGITQMWDNIATFFQPNGNIHVLCVYGERVFANKKTPIFTTFVVQLKVFLLIFLLI